MRIWRMGAFLTMTWAMISGATWYVTPDPQDPFDRVGRAVMEAGAGDTILVAPGTYYEHIPLQGRDVTIVGTGGPDQTTLDGSLPIEGREGSVLYDETGNRSSFRIAGIRIVGGSGTEGPPGHNGIGGGLALLAMQSVEIRDCIFEDNVADPNIDGEGGAAYIGSANTHIVGCRFQDNHSYFEGDHLLLGGGNHLIDGCRFEIDATGGVQGAAVSAYGSQLTVRGCEFHATSGEAHTYGLWVSVLDAVVTDNRFVDDGSSAATRLLFSWSGVSPPAQSVEIARNLFWQQAPAGDWDEIGIGQTLGTILIHENTFVGTDLITDQGLGSTLRVNNNILFQARGRFDARSGGAVLCNDAWPDSGLSSPCCGVQFRDNISADPLFCERGSGDFQLDQRSPCTAEHSPPGCGQIGAFGPSCEITPVRKTTWGSLKRLFR